MDQRRMQSREPSKDRRLVDLDDAPALDASEETALEAIRRQLDEEFAKAEAMPERPEPRRTRAVPERDARARLAPDAEERSARRSREPHQPARARPDRFRDERPFPAASRFVREPTARVAPGRSIPAQWREVDPPSPDEPGSRGGLLVTIGVAAGLAGGAAGALLTVLLLAGPPGALRQSWDRVVAAARDGGLLDVAATVKDRALAADPRASAPRASARPSPEGPSSPPASARRQGPVTTSEIPDPVERGASRHEPAASLELRGLVAAGREAYVRRDYAMAERLFAQAVERSTSDGLLRYHHAIALMGLGRFSEARAQFQNALRLGVDPMVADEAQRALAQLSTSRRRR